MITEEDFLEYNLKYLVYQLEAGEENHTPHFQGYIVCKQSVRFTHFHPLLERAHFEIAKGTPEQCKEYCTKEDTRLEGPWEFGTLPAAGSGSRNDLIDLREAIKGGKRGRDIYDDDCLVRAAVRYNSGMVSMVSAYTRAEPRPDVRVTLHFGPAGTGKTHCCYDDEDTDCYLYDGNANGFWNGYTGQSKVCVICPNKGRGLAPLPAPEPAAPLDRNPINLGLALRLVSFQSMRHNFQASTYHILGYL